MSDLRVFTLFELERDLRFVADYDVLLSLSEELDTDEWQLLSYQKTPGYYYPWMKLCYKPLILLPSRFTSGFLYGISIDIFPLDCINETDKNEALSKAERINQFYKHSVKSYKPYSSLKTGGLNTCRQLLKRGYFYGNNILRGPLKEKVYKKIEDERRKDEPSADNFVCNIFAKKLVVFPSTDFSGEKEHLAFHGRDFLVPSGYRDVLATRYGADYMQPPPVPEQKSGHKYEVYYR